MAGHADDGSGSLYDPAAFLVLQRVMRPDSPLGIPPETEPPDDLGRPVCPGGPGKVLQGIMASAVRFPIDSASPGKG